MLLNWIRVLEGMGVKFDVNSPLKKLEDTMKGLDAWKGQYDAYHPFSMIEP